MDTLIVRMHTHILLPPVSCLVDEEFVAIVCVCVCLCVVVCICHRCRAW